MKAFQSDVIEVVNIEFVSCTILKPFDNIEKHVVRKKKFSMVRAN